MSTDHLLVWIFDGALATSFALVLVLSLRRILRRAFGARVAYAAWMLVPLALLAASLPAPQVDTVLLHALPTFRPTVLVGAAVPLGGSADVQGAAGDAANRFDWIVALLGLWGTGAIVFALRFNGQQRRFVAGLGLLQPRADGTFASCADQGPLVIGVWQPRIVLPADFERRYPQSQAALMVAHEREHVRRGDVRAGFAAIALRCLYWFNPLLHIAASRFRLDQELACDADVLSRYPHSRRAYADAMLNTQLAVPGLPVGCHWQSSQSLKERILMLKRPLPKAWRRTTGALVVCVLLAGSSYAAWAMRRADTGPSEKGTLMPSRLYVDVRQKNRKSGLYTTAGGMGNGPGGVSRIYADASDTLHVGFGAPDAPGRGVVWVAKAREHQGARMLDWRVEKNGTAVDRGSVRLIDGHPADVAIDGSRYGFDDEASLQVEYAGRPQWAGEFDDHKRSFPRQSDGAYLNAHGGGLYAAKYKSAGDADVLVAVSASGSVTATHVERSEPAGVFTDEDAQTAFKGQHFDPAVENGVAVPSRIRTKIEFGPGQPPASPAVAGDEVAHAAARDGTSPQRSPSPQQIGIAGIETPAPSYPSEAEALKQSGKVVLRLLVATDGSVRDARVVQSVPAGLFDAVSLKAARAWKFTPAKQDGHVVEGWVEVPITFDIPHPDKVSTPMKVARGTHPDALAYTWARIDFRDPRSPQEMGNCNPIKTDMDDKTGLMGDVMWCGLLKSASR